MEKFVERLVTIKPATKIGFGTGIFFVWYFIYVLCKYGFSFATIVNAVVSFVIGVIFLAIIVFAAVMIIDGLFSIGE